MARPTPYRQRAVPLRLLRPLGFAIGLLALAAALAVGATWLPAVRARLAPSGATAGLPDTMLLVTSHQNGSSNPPPSDVAVYQPETNTMRPVLDGAGGEPIVSPDGRQVFFVQREQGGAVARTRLVALASESLASQWSADFGTVDEKSGLWLHAAATGDRVYVASHVGGSTDPITIVALDRAGGREHARWSVDLAGNKAWGLKLYPAPDGKELSLLAAAGSSNQNAPLAYFRFSLPDGREELRRLPAASPNDTGLLYDGRATPDGRGLYQVGYTTGLAVTFLDFASGTTESLDLGLQPRSRGDFLPFESAVSHDGRRLYVLAPTIAQAAIVDLVARRLEQTVPVDTSAVVASARPSPLARAWGAFRGLFLQEAAAKVYFQGSMQLSPDGRRLYAIGTTGQSHEAQPKGVWVIDTAGWRVTDDWLPQAAPFQLILSADGRYLYAQNAPWDQGPESGVLRAIDTTTAAEVAATGALPGSTAYSLVEQYRQVYGKTPAVAGVRLGDAPAITPVAAIALGASPKAIVAGDRVTVEARFVDPATGTTLEPGQRAVRYEPPARVTATLSPGQTAPDPREEGAVTVALENAGYSVYRGVATPPRAGNWSLGVTAEWPDGARRRAQQANALIVQAAFDASDGRRYVVRVTTDPAQPAVRQPATVRAAFVDAATGAPLPDGATPSVGLPPKIEAAFFAQAGVTSVSLASVGHGVYEGKATLWSTETWTVRLSVTGPDGKDVTFEAGAVQAR